MDVLIDVMLMGESYKRPDSQSAQLNKDVRHDCSGLQHYWTPLDGSAQDRWLPQHSVRLQAAIRCPVHMAHCASYLTVPASISMGLSFALWAAYFSCSYSAACACVSLKLCGRVSLAHTLRAYILLCMLCLRMSLKLCCLS